MRVSTSQIYNTSITTFNQQQSNLLHLQQELSTGSRIVSPSDDPVAAARALEVSQSNSLNTQQTSSQGTASDALSRLDSSLGSINDIISYALERAIQAGNGSYSASDKAGIASDMSAQFDELMSQANTVDANGEYLFAGYKGDTQPFVGNLAGVTYQGDQGSRTLQVSNSRQIPVSANGDELFMKIDDGAGGTTDMFSIMSNLVTTLQNTSLSSSAYQAAIQKSISQLNNAQDNVLTMRSQTGSRMVEVDALTNISSDLKIQYADRTSKLIGVDYASTISEYQQQSTYLEASRSTFSKITGMNLFDYLK